MLYANNSSHENIYLVAVFTSMVIRGFFQRRLVYFDMHDSGSLYHNHMHFWRVIDLANFLRNFLKYPFNRDLHSLVNQFVVMQKNPLEQREQKVFKF